jgi:protoporphyrinogen oxidase
MGTLARGYELVDLLEAQGVRATVDPALAAPPCVLIPPPNLTFDLACAVDATWQVVALAPAVNTADRTSWEALDELLDGLGKVVDISSADVVAYFLNGRSYPAYLVTFTEGI